MKPRRKDVPERFKWRHFEPEIILLCVRWYLSYRLSYRNLVEMMNERGLSIAHTTILRWVSGKEDSNQGRDFIHTIFGISAPDFNDQLSKNMAF